MSQTLKFDQITSAFEKSVQNATRLFGAGMKSLDEYPEIACGLFELGQEELGKSFSCLAAFGFRNDIECWKTFWKAWKDHNIKAYRAFFYEILNPLRIVLKDRTGKTHSGLPLKSKIPKEKEFSFYINYDDSSKTFVLPEDSISKVECFNRGMTLSYLTMTALAVQNCMSKKDSEFNYTAFSVLPNSDNIRKCLSTRYVWLVR